MPKVAAPGRRDQQDLGRSRPETAQEWTTVPLETADESKRLSRYSPKRSPA